MSLVVENLTYTYDCGEFAFLQKPLFSEVSFAVAPGSILHIIGENGSGKTTLLKIIAGILVVDDICVKYKNQPIAEQSLCYKQQICYVGHKLGINLQLSVLENCCYDLKNNSSMSEIVEFLQFFQLYAVRDKPCGQLSAGQKKRVALMRLLLSSAEIWILDEPFTALDTEFVKIFLECMRRHLNNSGLIIYTSHQSLDLPGCKHSEYYL